MFKLRKIEDEINWGVEMLGGGELTEQKFGILFLHLDLRNLDSLDFFKKRN